MGKFFKFIIIVLVLALGGLYGHYRYILKTDKENAPPSFWAYLQGLVESARTEVAEETRTEEEPSPEPVAREVRREAPPPPKKRLEEKVVETEKPEAREVQPPKPKVDWSRVERLRNDANRAYEAAQFDKAYQKMKEIKRILIEAGEVSNPIYKWADRYSKRARVFSALLSRMKRSELATGRDIYVLRLETGANLWVRVIREDEDGVWFEKEGGIESMVPRDNIVDMIEKTPEEYKNYLKEKFRERERLLSRDDYMGRFINLVVFARRYGLDDKITPLLEDIFEHSGSENIVQMFILEGDPDEYVVALLEGFGRDAAARRYRERSMRFAWRRPSESTGITPSREEPKENPPEETTPSETEPKTEPGDEGREPVGVKPPHPLDSEPPRPMSRGLEKLSASERAEFDELRRLMNEGQQKMNAAVLAEGNRRFRLGEEANRAVTKALQIVRRLRDAHSDIIELEMIEQQLTIMRHTIVKHLLPAR